MVLIRNKKATFDYQLLETFEFSPLTGVIILDPTRLDPILFPAPKTLFLGKRSANIFVISFTSSLVAFFGSSIINRALTASVISSSTPLFSSLSSIAFSFLTGPKIACILNL